MSTTKTLSVSGASAIELATSNQPGNPPGIPSAIGTFPGQSIAVLDPKQYPSLAAIDLDLLDALNFSQVLFNSICAEWARQTGHAKCIASRLAWLGLAGPAASQTSVVDRMTRCNGVIFDSSAELDPGLLPYP